MLTAAPGTAYRGSSGNLKLWDILGFATCDICVVVRLDLRSKGWGFFC